MSYPALRFLLSALLALALALAPAPVFAAGAKKADPKAGEEEFEVARAVEVGSVPAPVFDGRRLLNYFFLSVRVDMKEGENILRARERVHFFRDALVRGLHRRSVAAPQSFDVLDRAVALEVVKAAAAEAYGAGSIASVDVTSAESLRRGPVRPAAK